MKLYNKGKRIFIVGEKEEFKPNKVKEIKDDFAEKLLKAYPREIIKFSDYVSPKEQKIENVKLIKENKEKEENIKNLENEIKELKEKNEKLVEKIKDLKK
jgi:hypothetical protein